MPKKFIKAEKAIEKEIKEGKIPKTYINKEGKRVKSNAYALARHATGYFGTTHDIGMIHPIKKKHHSKKHEEHERKESMKQEFKEHENHIKKRMFDFR